MQRPKEDKLSRRSFIKKSVGTAVGMYLTGYCGHSLAFGPPKKSTVFEVVHPGVISENRKIDQSIVREMIQQGIKTLTGSNNPLSQFVSPEDRVGLKINTLISNRAFEKGLICYPGSGGADGVRGDHILLAPPFIITEEQIDAIMSILHSTIAEITRDHNL